jgi:quercetin dioxygenase-like cupin family protein
MGPAVRAAEVVVGCAEVGATVAFFTDRLGFRLDAVHPADDPSVAVISGHGLRIRLQRGAAAGPGVIRILCGDPSASFGGARELVAPNGTRIEIADADPPVVLPPLRPSFVLSRAGDGARWIEGRAGMRYRDLIPGRQGGRYVASHIQIARGGPVPDYVHFHAVRLQMIYCKAGWVGVVYEDQGAPFVLRAGDCVLQPPRIRHRVLESSAGAEVIEVGAPAEHETFADHDLTLPTAQLRADRDFEGQRFVRHEGSTAEWRPWRIDGFEARDLGIADATGGIASAHVARALRGPRQSQRTTHGGELRLVVVLGGEATLDCEGRPREHVAEGDAFVVPAGLRHALEDCTDAFELLEVDVHGLGIAARSKRSSTEM